jgi:hypothetical protein
MQVGQNYIINNIIYVMTDTNKNQPAFAFQIGHLPLNLGKFWERNKQNFDFAMHLLHFSH